MRFEWRSLRAPICGLFILADRGPEGIALLFVALSPPLVVATISRHLSRHPQPVPQLVRGASGVYDLPSAEPPRSMVITVARRPPPIAKMQGGELWSRAPGGWQMGHVELT